MKRDSAIELYRCLLMFGICWLHCCQQGGHMSETMNAYYLMRPCVVGFVFITGWFGIRVGMKSLRLILISAVCSVVSIGLKELSSGWHGVGTFVGDFVYSFVTGYWFLWAYVALMLLSPILNAALEGNRREVNVRVLPLFGLIFGWSFLTHVPGVKSLVPQTSGVTALSCLMMSAVYLVARLIRLRGYDRFLKGWRFWSVVGLSVIVCAAGFSHYDSPFALVVAVGLFQFVRRLKLPEWLGNAVLWIAPSMFAVYILHQTYRGFGFIGLGMSVGEYLGVSSSYLQTFVAAVVVFALCVMVDCLRRVMFSVLYWCVRGGARE